MMLTFALLGDGKHDNTKMIILIKKYIIVVKMTISYRRDSGM